MLYTEREYRVMEKAVQPNMRKLTNVQPFINIINDYFSRAHFMGKHILDIGPGQCDFLDLAKKYGAVTYGVDGDPAVVELGEMRGHKMMRVSSFQSEWNYGTEQFDGMFCRSSINYLSCAFLPDGAIEFVKKLLMSAKPTAWIWIVPWAKCPEGQEDMEKPTRRLIYALLKALNITVYAPSEMEKDRYGLHYAIPKIEIWIRPGIF